MCTKPAKLARGLYKFVPIPYHILMIDKATIENVRLKFNSLQAILDERSRRLWAATEARALGHGGIHALTTITGLTAVTIRKGLKELETPEEIAAMAGRVRQPGGGTKSIIERQPEICNALKQLLESDRRGDPMSPLLWTSKSTRKLADELKAMKFQVSHQTVKELLHAMGFSLQANKKIIEGTNHPDRDEQFSFINQKAKDFQAGNQPVISVDTKKKELIGDFKNAGEE